MRRLILIYHWRLATIDLSSSQYADDQMFPVQAYDGRRIPFADSSFDVVFSSNVLEHIRDLSARTPRLDGYCGQAGGACT